MKLTILAVGDVVGDEGVAYLQRRLSPLKRLKAVDFTVVNGENAAGTGLLPRQAEDILSAGADVVTLGNHTWGKRQICPVLDDNARLLRPANMAPQLPGRGWGIFECGRWRVAVLNLIGRCGMDFGPESPFTAADKILRECETEIRLVDFHAEATSEKAAMAYHLDGRVSALWGTHTHVQTADERIFPKGTGFITDLGMTGPLNSVIGVRPEQSVTMFLGGLPGRFEVADGPCKLDGCLFELDPENGRCTALERVSVRD